MKITLNRSNELVELVAAMASKDSATAMAARETFAAFMGPTLNEVIDQAPTLSNLFTNFTFNSDDNPSIPLDIYSDVTDVDYIRVWQQSVPGGLATNEVHPSNQELKLTTYQLETAISFDRKHAAKSRLDVVGRSMARLAQEVLNDQENISAGMLLAALAKAETAGKKHVERAVTSGRFLPEDFVTLDTLLKRLHTSWMGGTPVRGRRAVTDMLVSPEVIAEIRRMAYNPISTKGSPNGGTAGDGFLAPDAFRNQMWNNAGLSNFWGINLHEILELGEGQRWNKMFEKLANGETYAKPDGSGTAAFSDAQDQIIIGLDLTTESLIRPIATNSDIGSEFNLQVDDQFPVRAKKIGFWGDMEEGRQIIDDRVLVGKIVQL